MKLPVLLSLLLLTSCGKLGPIEYPAPNKIADQALSFIHEGNVDSLKLLIHPDNLRRMEPGVLENLVTAGKQVITSTAGEMPFKIDSTTSDAYNLGGEVKVKTYEYIFPFHQPTADTLRSIFISVAKGKVIGINVSQ